jgi:hypothetical protein
MGDERVGPRTHIAVPGFSGVKLRFLGPGVKSDLSRAK